jgi:hypothetical protein
LRGGKKARREDVPQSRKGRKKRRFPAKPQREKKRRFPAKGESREEKISRKAAKSQSDVQNLNC